MEKVIEFLLILLWDAVKTVILQWLMNRLKDWWVERKSVPTPQYA